jgi:hypothetical protein
MLPYRVCEGLSSVLASGLLVSCVQRRYNACWSATRWSKGSFGFRVDRELKINPLIS